MPSVQLVIAYHQPSSALASAPKRPTGIPSASAGQKCRPYRRIDSATSCPIGRSPGGSAGGSGCFGFAFLATAQR